MLGRAVNVLRTGDSADFVRYGGSMKTRLDGKRASDNGTTYWRSALLFLAFSLIVAIAVCLSASILALRFLTFGYEVSPLAGLYVACCGVATVAVANRVRRSPLSD